MKLLQCYGIFLISLNLVCTKIKTNPNPVITQHIRERSRKPFTPQVREWTVTLASPPFSLNLKKKKTRQNQQSYFRKDKNIWENAQLNQQKNTSTVIIWFIPTEDKHLHSFLIFDIKDFYSSIKEKLLRKALKFVESYTDISDEGKRIINHSRKSLLFNSKQAWIKKESTLFDITKKAGAKLCQLVVSFTLSSFKNKCKKKKDIVLYRDE